VSLSPIAPPTPVSAGASAPASAAPRASTTFPNTIVDQTTTAVPPPGYTQTVTTQEDGSVTTVTDNASGVPVDTIFTTATMNGADVGATGPSVNVWA
jgi:hypothetical protein